MPAPKDANENARSQWLGAAHFLLIFAVGVAVKIFDSLRERQELKLSTAFRLHCISLSKGFVGAEKGPGNGREM